MQRLFIIKDGDDYFRFSEQGYTRCSLQKASVYPLDDKQKAARLVQQLHDDGLQQARLFVLSLSEEPYVEERSKP